MEPITPQTCRTCGLCCVSLQDQGTFCDVTAEDMRRLGPRFTRLHVIQSTPFDLFAHTLTAPGSLPGGAIKTRWREQRAGPFRGAEACVCTALRGSLLHRVSCSVYERRPATCRKAVNPGDRTCRRLRRMYMDAADLP